MTTFVYKPRWFVISQTIGDEFTPTRLPQWDSERALAVLGIEQIPFTETNGNCQGYARGRQIAINPAAQTDLSQGAVGHDGFTNVDKAAVAAKVTVAGRQFYVVNTHLCWSACADSQGSEFSLIHTTTFWAGTYSDGKGFQTPRRPAESQ